MAEPQAILLVEDEPLTLWSAARALRRAGYVVLEAHDANEAVSAASSYSGAIALFVIDALLSGTLGAEVAALLHDHNPQVPILYLSGYDADVLDATSLETEGTYVLPHAFAQSQLVSRIRQILAQTTFTSLKDAAIYP